MPGNYPEQGRNLVLSTNTSCAGHQPEVQPSMGHVCTPDRSRPAAACQQNGYKTGTGIMMILANADNDPKNRKGKSYRGWSVGGHQRTWRGTRQAKQTLGERFEVDRGPGAIRSANVTHARLHLGLVPSTTGVRAQHQIAALLRIVPRHAQVGLPQCIGMHRHPS
ncbi:hypothetical protein BD779DRAFT_1705055 [Infundibulicybe gibba]|nr:hypothetical protein BD779DRAFT_1705055 [Infundibulicybe gibba]